MNVEMVMIATRMQLVLIRLVLSLVFVPLVSLVMERLVLVSVLTQPFLFIYLLIIVIIRYQ